MITLNISCTACGSKYIYELLFNNEKLLAGSTFTVKCE